MWAKQKQSAFTIVELLVVIVVIAVLAAITITAYTGIQKRARDSVRVQDISNIKKSLLLYQSYNGGVPATTTFGGNGPGGWNLSSSGTWLSFLSPILPKIPVDPVNSGITDPSAGGLAYYCYCYNTGSGPMPATPNVSLGYHSEVSNQNIAIGIPVERCL